MSQITITINGVEQVLADNLNKSISTHDGYKYTYLKQVVSRLRSVKSNIRDLPEETQIAIMSNTLIAERNIANFAAEQYAMLNNEEFFVTLSTIVEEIESLFVQQ